MNRNEALADTLTETLNFDLAALQATVEIEDDGHLYLVAYLSDEDKIDEWLAAMDEQTDAVDAMVARHGYVRDTGRQGNTDTGWWAMYVPMQKVPDTAYSIVDATTGEAFYGHTDLTLSEAAQWLLDADGHSGEVRQGSDGWWEAHQDGRGLVGIGSHRTRKDAERAVVDLDVDWAGFYAEDITG